MLHLLFFICLVILKQCSAELHHIIIRYMQCTTFAQYVDDAAYGMFKIIDYKDIDPVQQPFGSNGAQLYLHLGDARLYGWVQGVLFVRTELIHRIP